MGSVPPGGRTRGRWLLRSLGWLGTVGLAALAIWDAACGAQAGMFCLQQSDCRPGLVCNKPPSASRPEHYGICEPARRNSGESCLRSSDCATGLRCSTELGTDSRDERHGICIPLPGSPSD